MFKFAFIMNVPGTCPENYASVVENELCYDLFAGTSDMDMTEELVKDLAEKEFAVVNLCGDFTDEDVDRLMTATDNKLKITHAGYYPEELERLESLPSLKEFGIIVKDDGVTEIQSVYMNAEECNAYIKLVKDLEDAKIAAAQLADEGAVFIELCSWFDSKMMDEVSVAIDKRLPMGTCGQFV